ncbi:unnamed protein product [Lupinus luteus]|uniref:Cellulose synthase-like protein D1 n=1 Tax=Lupinus luteus TaxID=3873 RepID=A0AAV1YLL8_LUPLU
MTRSSNSPPKSASGGGRPPQGVKFTRRTSSGRVVSLSRDDDIDMSGEFAGPNDYIDYTVMMPLTPDNQPGISDSKQDGATGSYGTTRFASESQQDNNGGGSKMDRRMSILNSTNNKSMLLRSQTQDFDHNRWLFETKGTYGIGNAFWQDDSALGEDMSMSDFMDKPWKPLTRKIKIPGAILSPYSIKKDPTKNKKRHDFVKDRRWIKREYDEFKVRINGLPDVIQKRSKMYNNREEKKEKQLVMEKNGGVLPTDQKIDVLKATWMADGTHWPGTWHSPIADHSKGDHAGILQVMSKVPEHDPVMGYADEKSLDFTGIDIRIPMFAYVSREKRPGYDHNKKAGAMNAMVRASAILSNGPFILNLDCDHYIYNSLAMKEGMCFMMDRGGDRICYIQFPQRFEGIDPSDRYANHNTVFFDGNMRALDGLQGPMYVGTGCMFRRYALYGFEPPRFMEHTGVFGRLKTKVNRNALHARPNIDDDSQPLTSDSEVGFPQKFGSSTMFTDSIAVAEFQARPLADHKSVKNGRPPGALLVPRPPLDAPTVAEAIAVISCWYEDKTEWGDRIGWIYGSVTEDVVTGYRMHNRGWSSAHLVAVIQGLLKVIAGIEISFKLTTKSSGEDEDDAYADLYLVKWTSLFIMPLTIIIINIVAVIMGCLRTVYSVIPQWNKLLGSLFFSFWVLSHMYPFAKGLMGRRGRVPTIIYVWAGLLSITIALLWISIDPPTDQVGSASGGDIEI